jgi:hypothetical protein
VFIIASLGGPEDLLGVRLAYCAFVLLRAKGVRGYFDTKVQGNGLLEVLSQEQ